MKHSKELDEEKLSFACDLIRKLWVKHSEYTALAFVADILRILDFGNVSNQDLQDFMESIEWE